MRPPDPSPAEPAGSAPDAAVLTLGPRGRAELCTLSEQLPLLVAAGGYAVVVCDASALGGDVATVDALAHFVLAARRLGCRARLRGVPPQLDALLALCGLTDVFGCGALAGERRRARGQPEEREQARGVEERVEARDPPA